MVIEVPTLAGGQGFEPQLPGSEPGVLPLDDPPISLKTPIKYHKKRLFKRSGRIVS